MTADEYDALGGTAGSTAARLAPLSAERRRRAMTDREAAKTKILDADKEYQGVLYQNEESVPLLGTPRPRFDHARDS
jgi:hypothetical protein